MMDFEETLDTAICAAKADVDEMQAEGVIVDTWGIVRLVLTHLNGAHRPAEEVEQAAVQQTENQAADGTGGGD